MNWGLKPQVPEATVLSGPKEVTLATASQPGPAEPPLSRFTCSLGGWADGYVYVCVPQR